MVSQKPENKLMFTNRALFALTLPMVLSALLSLSAGIIDSIMVSSVGEAAVGAISLTDPVQVLLITFFSAVAHGGVVVCAQHIGSGNLDRAKCAARQLFYSSTAVALLTSLLCLPFLSQIINFLFPNIESSVFENAKTYLSWTLIGIPFYAIGGACCDLLRAQANSKIPLVMATVITVLNVMGNAILIYGFRLGVAGAAISTAFSRFAYAVAGMILIRRKNVQVPLRNLFPIKLDFGILKNIFKIGGSNGIENALFYSGSLILATLTATFPTIYIAANSVANTLCNFGWSTITTLGAVLITVVGQCIGAEEHEQAKKYTKKMTFVATVAMLLIFGAIFFSRDYLVLLFDFTEETRAVAARITGLGAILTILSVYSFAFVPTSAFHAAGEIKFPLISSISSLFIFRIGLAFLLVKVFRMGVESVWLGMFADWLFRSILNTIHFYRGRWLLKRAI